MQGKAAPRQPSGPSWQPPVGWAEQVVKGATMGKLKEAVMHAQAAPQEAAVRTSPSSLLVAPRAATKFPRPLCAPLGARRH